MKQVNTTGKFFLGLLLALTVVLSCNKNVNDITNPDPTPDLTTKVNASISGFVVNENNTPAAGASVAVGNKTTITDNYGFFQVKNVDVVKTAAVVTISKSGYFNSIKTFTAVQGKSAFIRVRMIPKTNAGSINATSGGNVSTTDGMSVSLPSAGVVNAASNTTYNGTINVAMHWINPTSSEGNQEMPGDLRGINTGGGLKALQSFGMVAVELTGASGELLQIASGKKATLTFPIPSTLTGNAPSSIPLWSFDETKGLWKEEGTATKNGNNYVGEVAHFSFWNCDMPANYVQFDCTILNADNTPLPFTMVKITDLANPTNWRVGYTDSSGYVAGLVPDNASLKLEVFNYFACNTAVYTQNFSTSNTPVSLGNIVLSSASLSNAEVSGTVTDCNNLPVTSGWIIVMKSNQYYRYGINSNGTYHFNSLLCNGPETVTLIAEDASSLQQSSPSTYTFTDGPLTVPNIQACGTSTSQYFNYTVNGSNYTFTSPVDSFYMYTNPQVTPSQITISAEQFSPGQNGYVYMSFDEPGIAVGSAQPLRTFYAMQASDSAVVNQPFNVNITEYGSVGQFIAGNFSGTMTGTTNTYTISGNFRVRRR